MLNTGVDGRAKSCSCFLFFLNSTVHTIAPQWALEFAASFAGEDMPTSKYCVRARHVPQQDTFRRLRGAEYIYIGANHMLCMIMNVWGRLCYQFGP